MNVYSRMRKHQRTTYCSTNQMSSHLKRKCVFQRVRLIQIITLVSSMENPERREITGAYRIKATAHKVSRRAE